MHEQLDHVSRLQSLPGALPDVTISSLGEVCRVHTYPSKNYALEQFSNEFPA